jgi:hypothetical protein
LVDHQIPLLCGGFDSSNAPMKDCYQYNLGITEIVWERERERER